MNLPRRFRAAVAAVSALSVAATGLASTQAAAQAQTATPPAGCTGPASNTWLNVVVDGVRNSDGLIAVTLYADDSSKFLMHHGSLYVGRVDARSGSTRACIFVPRTGVYAIAIYHDENASRGLDRSGLGLPTEGFGFSNNPSTIAGIPAFRSVRLNVPRSNLTTRIQLRYP